MYRDENPHCAACAAALERRGSHWACAACGSVLVPSAEIEAAMNEAALDDYRELADRLIPTSGSGSTCPCCATQMARYVMHGVSIDRCEQHGIWFERGEMQRVLAEQRAAYEKRFPDVPRGAWFPMGIGVIVGALLSPWLERRALRKHVASTSPRKRRG
jgi:hypothetical protein